MSKRLTRDKILNEPAGPRMNRWVGELIIGLQVRRHWSVDGGCWRYDLTGPGVSQEGFADEGGAWAACPAYSTGLEAAMLVAEQSISNIELRRMRHTADEWHWMAHLRFTESTG